MKIENHDCFLIDDGTMDTVIKIDGQVFRYDRDFVIDSGYRDIDGRMTESGFYALCEDAIEQMAMTE